MRTKPFNLFLLCILSGVLFTSACKKNIENPNTQTVPETENFFCNKIQFDEQVQAPYFSVKNTAKIKLQFSAKVDSSSVLGGIQILDAKSNAIPFDFTILNGDTQVVLQAKNPFKSFYRFTLCLIYKLKTQKGTSLAKNQYYAFYTEADTVPKFPLISDNELLDLVQKNTFNYFWKNGHPSGFARERNNSGDLVTTGGSGFGIMSMLVASSRNFISRTEAALKINSMCDFLQNKSQKFHGAFPHWFNGVSGNVIPFGANDNGADLVETSYLMQGLLCARQYFDRNDSLEIGIRTKINQIYQGVEWNWFRKNNQQVLYWHWSANLGWVMNMQIKGWNECLITYIMAACSPTDSIPASVYHQGWASYGGIKNGSSYYGYRLPLGEAYGGPLFFSQYTFLGVNPNQLTDLYADYWEQNVNHSKINYAYCVANPKNYFGYSANFWGLTASDNNVNGYAAHSPSNDLGVISPTAALSAMPYTPKESMAALRFMYYQLGEQAFKENGFVDAINLNDFWFADSFLAIDQGPIIGMIENYRTGLLWNLLMSCPEVKTGMKKLGFNSPYLN